MNSLNFNCKYVYLRLQYYKYRFQIIADPIITRETRINSYCMGLGIYISNLHNNIKEKILIDYNKNVMKQELKFHRHRMREYEKELIQSDDTFIKKLNQLPEK